MNITLRILLGVVFRLATAVTPTQSAALAQPLCVLDPGLPLAGNTYARRATLAQTFVPTKTGTLAQVTHGLRKASSSAPSYKLSITTTASSGAPSWPAGVLYASSSLSVFATGPNVDGKVPISGGPLLLAGTKYALVLEPIGPGDMYWRGNSSAGSYPAGAAFERVGAGNWALSNVGPKDLGFVINGAGQGTSGACKQPASIVSKTITVGPGFSLSIDSAGNVWGTGINDQGQVAVSPSTGTATPVMLPGLSNIVAVQAGYYWATALDSTGNVWEWGHTPMISGAYFTPKKVASLSGVVEIGTDFLRNYARTSSGEVWRWATPATLYPPAKVVGLTGVVGMAFGSGGHILTLDSAGQVWGLGKNNLGQLGDGTTIDRTSPVKLSGASGLASVIAISADVFTSMALDSSGTVWTWGHNGGQLATGTTAPFLTLPGKVVSSTGLPAAKAIEMSLDGYAIDSSGQVWSWGKSNFTGSLGIGTTAPNPLPIKVIQNGYGPVTSFAATHAGHVLVRTSAGQVWSWGQNNKGQLGIGNTANSTVPQKSLLP